MRSGEAREAGPGGHQMDDAMGSLAAGRELAALGRVDGRSRCFQHRGRPGDAKRTPAKAGFAGRRWAEAAQTRQIVHPRAREHGVGHLR